MDKVYDIGIIGGGVAGAFAALRIAENHKNKSCVLFELGRPPAKRRRQLEGWLGCFPFGDGKLYPGNVDQLSDLVHGRRSSSMKKWFFKQINNINETKLIKAKQLGSNLQKRIAQNNFKVISHDYYQWKPESIHQLSRDISDRIEKAGNVEFSFDNEVYNIMKHNDNFTITTNDGEYNCKKIILCVGRSGWRWVNKLYKDFGILVSDDIAEYGVRVELPAQYLKEFNKSHCSLIRDDISLGPFSWGGQVIQEDHADMTIASFRSNEDRWKTDKVFFSMLIKKEIPGKACSGTERIAKLAFLLSQDRVGREKVKSFIKGDSQLSLIPEFNWLNEYFVEVEKVIPTIISRGYFHCPDIKSMTSNIRIDPNLETEVSGMYVAGESAGIRGIVGAGVSGGIAAECASK